MFGTIKHTSLSGQGLGKCFKALYSMRVVVVVDKSKTEQTISVYYYLNLAYLTLVPFPFPYTECTMCKEKRQTQNVILLKLLFRVLIIDAYSSTM
jgi:hypothetical protein